MDKSLAELLGAFSGDGWISKSNSTLSLFITGNPKEEKEYYERIKFLFKNSLGVNVTSRNFTYWKTYGVLLTKQEPIKKFIENGGVVGHKASVVKVPREIEQNLDLYVPFIRGVFDTDGCVYFQKSYNKNASKWQKSCRHRPAVLFSTVSKNLANSLKNMLYQLGFSFRLRHSKPAKVGKYDAYVLRLEGKQNTVDFFNIINPANERHLKKFRKWREQGFY